MVAYDLGVPSLSSTLTLSVTVQDTNDNAPTFQKEFYQIEVDESLPKDSQILPLNARDLDKGKNGRLTYAIIESDSAAQNYVGLLPSSGIIFLKNQLDREKIQSLSFTVRVQDHGVQPKSATASVQITVKDVNDNRPTFSEKSYQFKVNENVPSDFLVGRVSAVDEDSGHNAEITFNLKSASKDFRIDGPTGECCSKASLW